jgi:DivIVA domain-containing protein
VGLIVIVLLGVIVLVGVALLLSLNEGGLRDAPVDHADLGLPDRTLTADDIPRLRFRTGLRGYRMEDVDAALERITQALYGQQVDAVTAAGPTGPESGSALDPAPAPRLDPGPGPGAEVES